MLLSNTHGSEPSRGVGDYKPGLVQYKALYDGMLNYKQNTIIILLLEKPTPSFNFWIE